MSRESRLAKRDLKLKKLANKRGLDRLPPQKRSTGDMQHLARALYVAKLAQKNQSEMERALKVVQPPVLGDTVPESRKLFEAFLRDLATEAKLLGPDGKRVDVDKLTVELSEHLARHEHKRWLKAH